MPDLVAHWPNGSRIAIALTVMFETWAEGTWPQLSTKHAKTPEGEIDHQSITWGQYGGRAGVWRIIRILDRHGVPGTFCTNAQSAEVYPEATRQILRSGHDIAAHGYTQDQLLSRMTPEQEHVAIRRCLDTLEASTGKRPEGWLSPILAWTPHTDEFLAQEKVLWRGDANYCDLPCRVPTDFGPVVHIPHSDYTDNRVLALSPRQYYDAHSDTFDYLYEHEPLALLIMTVHCHFGGRPLMSAMLDRLLRYFRGFQGVWFARHGELARWALRTESEEISNAQRFFPNPASHATSRR